MNCYCTKFQLAVTYKDMQHRYTKIQDVFLKKSCDEAESMFDIIELLLTV